MSLRSLYLLLALTLIIFMSGCGRKTLPIPPDAIIPKAIIDLSFVQDGDSVVLSWTYPKTTTTETGLGNIDSFQVFRAALPETDYCETCPVSFTSMVEVKFDQALADRKKNRATFAERVLLPGYRYIYKVKTKAGWRLVSDDSNIVSFGWESPAAAPEGLQAISGDRSILLSWQKVVNLLDGSVAGEGLQYQVIRNGEPKTFMPFAQLVSGQEFRDSGLINGHSYEYRVRAVRQKENSRFYGVVSQTVWATPEDLTAPMPLLSLSAVKVAGGVKFTWAKGREVDIAGYKVYRRPSSVEKRKLIATTGSHQWFLVDQMSLDPQVYLYSVTAFDRARPPNESLFSKELKYESF